MDQAIDQHFHTSMSKNKLPDSVMLACYLSRFLAVLILWIVNIYMIIELWKNWK